MKFMKEIRREPNETLEFLDSLEDSSAVTANLMDLSNRVESYKYGRLYLSGIDDVCPREYTLGNKLGMKRTQTAPFALRSLGDMGKSYHQFVQNYGGSYFRKGVEIVGFWRCVCGGEVFGTKPVAKCKVCGLPAKFSGYREYKFRIDKPMVSGKVDLLLNVHGRIRMAEIKNTDDVENPSGKQIAQLMGYMHFHKFASQKEWPLPVEIDDSVGYLLIVSRKFNYKMPARMHAVKKSDAVCQMLHDKAMAYTDAMTSDVLPPQLRSCVDTDFLSSKAKKCPLRDECMRR